MTTVTSTPEKTIDLQTRLPGCAVRRAAILIGFLALAWLPALCGSSAIEAAAVRFALAETPHPYFVPQEAALLYLAAPLVALSACVLFLSPGLLLALALDAAQTAERWILNGLALSLIVVSLVAAVIQAALGEPLIGRAFAVTVAGTSLACGGVWLCSIARGRGRNWPLTGPHATVTLASMIVVPWLLLAALAPKFYWETLNGDGAHALESSRLLLTRSLPFWPAEAGDVAAFPGLTSMLFAYPTSWFIRLFGPWEVSARLPVLLYLVGLFAAIVALAEHDRRPGLNLAARGLVWLSAIVYLVTLFYSASYDPYSADIALPATQDTLLMVAVLGVALSFARREPLWLALFVALTYTSLPSGLILLGLWAMAAALVWKPRPWRRLAILAAVVCGCLIAASVTGRVLEALELPAGGGEYGIKEFLKRFAYLQLTDLRRVLYAVVPAGIFPALAVLAWSRLDHLGRALAATALGYFLMMYFQAYVSLHHFVPAMILPLAACWRSQWWNMPALERRLTWASAALGALALWWSLPAHWGVQTAARELGGAIENRCAGYERNAPEAFLHTPLLARVVPYDWEPEVPEKCYGGSPLVWNYYAHRPAAANRAVNYVLQSSADPPPAGMRPLIVEGEAALYVASDEVWQRHRQQRFPSPPGSPLYALPRNKLFRALAQDDEPGVIRVAAVLRRLGLPVDRLVEDPGARR